MASTSKDPPNEILDERKPLLSQPSTSSSKDAPPQSVPGKKNSALRQLFLGVIVALPSVPFGMSLGFSAIALDELSFTVDEASWFASVTAMAYPFGALAVGPIMDKYGRRPALLSINLVSFFGWLLLSVNTSTPAIFKLITGRILTGIAGGLASVPATVYAAECLSSSDVSSRSALVTWSTVALSAGICLVYTTGSYLAYYAVASIATLISVVSFVLVAIFLPESPVWYSLRGRHGDAEWSLREIDINPPPAPPEQPSEAEDNRQNVPPTITPPPETFKELLKPEAYKPLLIMTGFFFFQQFSGVFVIIAYMVDIIRAAGVITVNPYFVTILAGSLVLVVSLIASLVYPKTGVRLIAIFSGLGTTATMLFIGIFLSLRTYWINRTQLYFLNWIPVFSILSGIGVSAVGFLILPWSMLGEVFPNNVKGLAAGIATCLGFTFSFIAAKIYPSIQLSLGVEGVFFFFGIMALLGTVFVIMFLPETRGKTFEEILHEFSGPKNKTKK